MDFVSTTKRIQWRCPIDVAAGDGVRWDLVDDGFDQLSYDDHSNACTGNDNVSDADDGLGDVHYCDHAGVCTSRFNSGFVDAIV